MPLASTSSSPSDSELSSVRCRVCVYVCVCVCVHAGMHVAYCLTLVYTKLPPRTSLVPKLLLMVRIPFFNHVLD